MADILEKERTIFHYNPKIRMRPWNVVAKFIQSLLIPWELRNKVRRPRIGSNVLKCMGLWVGRGTLTVGHNEGEVLGTHMLSVRW